MNITFAFKVTRRISCSALASFDNINGTVFADKGKETCCEETDSPIEIKDVIAFAKLCILKDGFS